MLKFELTLDEAQKLYSLLRKIRYNVLEDAESAEEADPENHKDFIESRRKCAKFISEIISKIADSR